MLQIGRVECREQVHQVTGARGGQIGGGLVGDFSGKPIASKWLLEANDAHKSRTVEADQKASSLIPNR